MDITLYAILKNKITEIRQKLLNVVEDATDMNSRIVQNTNNIEKKLDKNQGASNSGKIAGINESGDIVPMFPQGVTYNENTQCLEYGADEKLNLNAGIQLDDTLSKVGYAADAASVGELKSDLDDLDGKIYNGEFNAKFELVSGFIKASDGTYSSYSDSGKYACSKEFIKLPNNLKTITSNVHYTNSTGISFYSDASETSFIKSWYNAYLSTDIPNGAKYIRITDFDSSAIHNDIYVKFAFETYKSMIDDVSKKIQETSEKVESNAERIKEAVELINSNPGDVYNDFFYDRGDFFKKIEKHDYQLEFSSSESYKIVNGEFTKDGMFDVAVVRISNFTNVDSLELQLNETGRISKIIDASTVNCFVCIDKQTNTYRFVLQNMVRTSAELPASVKAELSVIRFLADGLYSGINVSKFIEICNKYFDYTKMAVRMPLFKKTQWYGKKMTTLGDSITADGEWQKKIVEYFGMQEFTSQCNQGVGGTTVAKWADSTDHMCSDARINLIPDDSDLIIMMGGTNDFSRPVPIGNAEYNDGFNETTFKGATASMITKVQSRFPNATLVIASQLSGRGDETAGSQKSNMTHFVKNSIGLTPFDYAKATLEVANEFSIPYIDLFSLTGINQFNRSGYIYDMVHPYTDNGRKAIANVFIMGLKNIGSKDMFDSFVL